ncbi:MAG: ABC transporter ATP-binding protein [Candidatus Latescibacteria bacterium]|nr:ABC transporter ATP-binding protein [Candidatus Latescibacterota bacterium]
METIKISEVTKNFQEGEHVVHAVNGVDITIENGEFAALAGPSGSGKTTLLNLIGGLDRPTSGEISIDGTQLSKRKDNELTEIRLRKIGFVFQAYNLIPVLTAYENVQFVLQVQGVPEREHHDRIMPILEDLGIKGLENRFPTQLSGGQQQRVAVARAVVGNPTIVLADEPTANLDSETSKSLLDLMRRLNTEKGVTFLFSTHDPMVIERARRVIRLRDGKVQADERKN